MVKIQIYIKMLVMILFHHHSSIYNKDWSKVSFSELCINPCYIYYYYTTTIYTTISLRQITFAFNTE